MYKDEHDKPISDLEKDTGVKIGFFNSLISEDDWSFIIKIHALYEASITSLLTNKLGRHELQGFISRLELGDRSRGKLKITKELKLLDEDERKFIYALSEIRNDFVHNVNNTQINLENYFESLNKDKKQYYINTFGYTYSENLTICGHTVNSKIFTKENPKIAIWHNSMHVLAIISCITATEKSRKSINQSIVRIHELQESMESMESMRSDLIDRE